MSMRRHRGAAPPPSDSSSSDEEDAFSAFSRKKKNSRKSLNKSSTPLSSSSTQPASATTSSSKGATAIPPTKTTSTSSQDEKQTQQQQQQTTETSSNKRHHHHSTARAAKMEALLQELQETSTTSASGAATGSSGGSASAAPYANSNLNRPLPDKMGSFVMPGEEYLTSNIFVGNLAPITTEEELTEVFRQFGDLYSVKIMWPRTAEERARGRNTGFVCFMNREDAQEAMDAFQDSDPLRTGRRMCLRWGKNVKKSVKRGTGGVPIPPIRRKEKTGSNGIESNDNVTKKVEEKDVGRPNEKKRKVEKHTLNIDGSNLGVNPPFESDGRGEMNEIPSSSLVQNGANSVGISDKPEIVSVTKFKGPVIDIPVYDPAVHASDAIRVMPPSDINRLRFITTVASFVAKDGSILEKKLIERESNNPKFSFLMRKESLPSNVPGLLSFNNNVMNDNEDREILKERIFYRWRVFAFTQGDGFDSWRTEPFTMIQPHGRFWIPPSLDAEAARREEEEAMQKEEYIRLQQEERRKLAGKKDFMTGRQLEHAKFGGSATAAAEGAVTLNDREMEQWMDIIQNKLCASRDAVCEAMSFCFDKSGAAKQISHLLKEALMDDRIGVSVETRIARLYLMSDVLFNSQQPGVKNAFRYRDAIEEMAPNVFENLGKHGQGTAGRMTMNKLRNAVSAVLCAWTNWSVYNSTFIDELQFRFEGKEVPPESVEKKGINDDTKEELVASENDGEEIIEEEEKSTEEAEAQSASFPRGDWTDTDVNSPAKSKVFEEKFDTNGDGTEVEDAHLDGEILDRDDVDGEVLDDNDVDGELLDDDDVDGEALDGEDFDGDPLSDDEDSGKDA